MFQLPSTQEEWKKIAKDFNDKCNFVHNLGGMDGMHVEVIPEKNTGSFYFNYKNKFSMVLLAIVDANYKFILCDFGTNGRVSDGGVFLNSDFYEMLQKNLLNIPPEEKLDNSQRVLPYVFVADDAFPLNKNIMKPFRQSELDSTAKIIFNYRLSRARLVTENCFGILSQRFRIFRTRINLTPKRVESVEMAICALHNYLMSSLPDYYAPPENLEDGSTITDFTIDSTFPDFTTDNIIDSTFPDFTTDNTIDSTFPDFTTNNIIDSTYQDLDHIESRQARSALSLAKKIRNKFMDYFNNEGNVPWQDNMIAND